MKLREQAPNSGEVSAALPYEARLIRSKRKTLALQIAADGSLIVRAPLLLPKEEIERFVLAHTKWIAIHRERQLAYRAKYPKPTAEEIAALTAKAKEVIPSRVAFFATKMGLTPTDIAIGHAKSRFGSCDRHDRLRFSCLLMRYPPEAVDYVVVHELAHIRHKNHGREFYALIAAYLPDYRRREALLRG